MRVLTCCSIASFLVGLLGCAHPSSSFDTRVFTAVQETEDGIWEEEGMIHAEAEEGGTDYDSAEFLATMRAVSKIGERIGERASAVIARPDFRIYVLRVTRDEPFYRVKVHAVILAP